MRLRGILAAFALGLAGGGALAGSPERVVSINLCTDQLAMMVAAPGQLVSVSAMAQDPRSSAMAGEAAELTANHGQAEEIFMMRPDLVIAGAFNSRITVDMLRRLGVPVLVVEPAYRLEDVGDRLRQVGKALGRDARAEALATGFEAALAETPEGPDPRAVLYTANGYMPGPQSLSGGILNAAGLRNVAAEIGISIGGRVELETLVVAEPDILILPQTYPGASRSEEILQHPALARLRARAGVAPMTDRDWVCGTPHVLTAIAGLEAARDRWAALR